MGDAGQAVPEVVHVVDAKLVEEDIHKDNNNGQSISVQKSSETPQKKENSTDVLLLNAMNVLVEKMVDKISDKIVLELQKPSTTIQQDGLGPVEDNMQNISSLTQKMKSKE